MNKLNMFYDWKNKLENIKEFFVTINKELVTVLWVMIVLFLIIWSYVENENSPSVKSELSMYQKGITISDTLKID